MRRAPSRFLTLAFFTLTACGGGGGFGPGSLAPGSPPATAISPVPSGTVAGSPRPSPSPPSSGGTFTPAPSPVNSATLATPAPAGPAGAAIASPTSPPDAAGHTNVVPPLPAAGTCRTGLDYSVYVQTPTGDTEAFTVLEPQTLCAGTTYPLVMWGPGYSGSRQTTPTTADPTLVGNIGTLVAANYGVVSIDERGYGEDGGQGRTMDPNFEGLMDLSVMDWAQANLKWIAYGPTLEGDDPHEPVMGAIGGSYGGMYQYMLLDIDRRHRLHAIVPEIAPSDLNYSLYPNGVVKDAWDIYLYASGATGGTGGNQDPFLTTATAGGLTTNAESPAAHDFFGYHSNSYFCNGRSIASDGNPGSVPLFAPNPPPKINAMLWQGLRDTLFTFNNAYDNYTCLARSGGDVRLLSYQFGHNALQVVPDPYVDLYYPAEDFLDKRCGSLSVDDATTAFFDRYLKGVPGAAGKIPSVPCLSIAAGDGVLVPSVTAGRNGTAFAIPATAVVAGGPPDVPTVVPLGPAFAASGVIGGLPHMDLTVTPVAATNEPFLFLGVGLMHASAPGAYDLLDNQLTPIRGAGEFDLDMTGIAARYAPGDRLALLVYGGEDQYYASSSTVNVAHPAPVAVTVAGAVWVPFVPNALAAP